MTLAELKRQIRSDLWRFHGGASAAALARTLLTGVGSKYLVVFRCAQYLRSKGALMRPCFLLSQRLLVYYGVRYGIGLPVETEVGPGLYTSYGSIFVNPAAKIGRNCNLGQGVTIGVSNRGTRKGCPEIGDGVYIGPGAKVFGKIRIGNNVAVGANAVVNADVPDNAVVVGVPAKVVSFEGAAGYVNNIDYAPVE